MATQGVTEEDLVIILQREIADELSRIGLDLETTDKRNEFAADLAYLRKQRRRDEKREDIIRYTLLALLITAAAYAVFQGVRYYILNGIDQVQAKPIKTGVLYEHAPTTTAANGPLDHPVPGADSQRMGAVAAATSGPAVQAHAGVGVRRARLLDRP